jgi:aminocarboxymuconate-semialdehyde decarboxylase
VDSRPMKVDVHAHVLPMGLLGWLSGVQLRGSVHVQKEVGGYWLRHASGLSHVVDPSFYDVGMRLSQMDRDGIDMSLLSLPASVFFYDESPSMTVELVQVANESVAGLLSQSAGRLLGMGLLPMNDPTAALTEAKRLRSLGLVGVELGTSVGTTMLDVPEFDAVYDQLVRDRLPIMLHPYLGIAGTALPGQDKYHLSNCVGNPYETHLAAARLMLGGVFDRHPDLRVVLTHGGGGLPYQLGRLDHAYTVRPEARVAALRPPREYLENFWFDTVVYDHASLEYLVGLVGRERVLFGTDRPYSMACPPGSWPSEGDVGLAGLHENALALYGLSARS